MTVRHLKPSDIPALQEMAARSGYPYPQMDGGRLESIMVVVDDDDRPVMAAAAERIIQIFLWCGEFEKPHAKVHAIRLLHGAMANELKRKGYQEANAFLPPDLAPKFKRRLEGLFGWRPNWPSWFKTF